MDYSISIGIEKYLELQETKYACADAEEFNRIMDEVFFINERVLLKDSNATLIQIQTVVESVFEKMQEGDRLLFYFAGHGVSFYNEPRLSCHDSKKNVPSSPMTWYNIYELMKKAEQAKVNALIFIDACESTVSYKRGVVDKNFDSEYVTVFSAANAEEAAGAEDEFGHGVWSHYLFLALKGVKNALKDDKLTNASLQEYLLLMVTEYYDKKYNNCTQTPYMWGKMSKTVIIKDYFNFELNNDYKIADIYFGIIDADNEYKKDKQVFIDNYYDLNEAAKKIEEQNNVQYIFGKKGTGKTYIGRYLEEKMGSNMKYLSLNKFNYKAFAFLAKDGNGYEPYMPIWQYVILSIFLDFVKQEQQNLEIEKYLKELFGFRVTLQQILNKKFKRGTEIQNRRIQNYFVTINEQI